MEYIIDILIVSIWYFSEKSFFGKIVSSEFDGLKISSKIGEIIVCLF